MPVTATTVFFPSEENSHAMGARSSGGLAAEDAEDADMGY